MSLELDRTELLDSPADGQTSLCLVVDDHDIIVHGLRSMLAPHCDDVTVRSLGEQRGVHADTVGPQDPSGAFVVLTDPFGSSSAIDELTDGLRDDADRVVFFTFDTSAAARLCSLGRADAVIAKSWSSEEILTELERVVSQDRVAGWQGGVAGRDGELTSLSDREREVLELLARGFTNRQIADVMFLSIDTIKTYLRRVYSKLGVENRTQAAIWAIGATPNQALDAAGDGRHDVRTRW
ncbi:MAG: response regulator transcription factor [Ilumatobacteraceae bacterium]